MYSETLDFSSLIPKYSTIISRISLKTLLNNLWGLSSTPNTLQYLIKSVKHRFRVLTFLNSRKGKKSRSHITTNFQQRCIPWSWSDLSSVPSQRLWLWKVRVKSLKLNQNWSFCLTRFQFNQTYKDKFIEFLAWHSDWTWVWQALWQTIRQAETTLYKSSRKQCYVFLENSVMCFSKILLNSFS